MFAALNIDRGNISNATSDNMLDDLGLTRGDFVCCSSQIRSFAEIFSAVNNP